MLDHLSLQVADVEAAAGFYLDVFAAIGISEAMRYETPDGLVVGLAGADGFPRLWFGPLVDAGIRPVHLALVAPDQAAVDAVQAAALARSAEILHPARRWPEYHAGYYGVFLRDLDGNNVEAVHHGAPS